MATAKREQLRGEAIKQISASSGREGGEVSEDQYIVMMAVGILLMGTFLGRFLPGEIWHPRTWLCAFVVGAALATIGVLNSGLS